MRCFIALPLPPSRRELLHRALEPIREALPDLAWIPPENYHLTLAFLGEQGPAGFQAAQKALASLAGAEAPLLRPAGLGRVPERGPLRVLSLEFCEGREACLRLRTRLGKALAAEAKAAKLAPLDPEWDEEAEASRRPFLLHLSLARPGGSRERELVPPIALGNASRSRAGGGLDAWPSPELAAAFREALADSGDWSADALLLYKSELSRSGARYKELERIPLDAGLRRPA